jgi:peptidoglycan hydrolase CwlO-like protein
LSTLTKILIVLVSIFSIFLCGIIVVYVGSSTNYKAAYEQQGSEFSAMKEKDRKLEQDIADKKRQLDEFGIKSDSEISKLKTEKTQLEQELKNTKNAQLAAEEKVASLTAAALNFEKAVGGMEDSLKQTRAELDSARTENVKLSKNLNEITANLEEKMAQLASVDTEKKRLLEEKAKLEKTSSGAAVEQPVTQMPDSATAAAETSADVKLQGVVTAVEGSLTTLSIGSADGVVAGMIFHVVRQDNFICDIKITEVDTEAAAGTIQLLQQQPKVGDIASTAW